MVIHEHREVLDGQPRFRAEVEYQGATRYALSLPADEYTAAEVRSACESWARARGLRIAR